MYVQSSFSLILLAIVKFHAKGFTKLSKRPLVAPARYNMRVFTNLHTLTQDAEFEAWKVNFPHNEIEEIKCDFLLGKNFKYRFIYCFSDRNISLGEENIMCSIYVPI